MPHLSGELLKARALVTSLALSHPLTQRATVLMVTDELSALTLQDDSSEGPRDSERTNAVESEVDPYHIPPLWLARRTACIQALRREGIRSVSDLQEIRIL